MNKEYYAIHCASNSKACDEASFYGIAYSFEEALGLVRKDIEDIKKEAQKWYPEIKAYLEEPAILQDEISNHQITCKFAYDEPKDCDDYQIVYTWMITKRGPKERFWETILAR